uniref:sigma-54-dependent transcriptional regulator n=1 Tax=Pararhizobium sp. IMCC3301 TaxID=3067904 RepID=UPI002741C7DF|nr:sigma-54 dependent transcriptional regulator [Pararhizobium sp. IMCC3301]
MNGHTILFVDDEEHLRLAARQALDLADLSVRCLEDGALALDLLGRSFPGILISDIRMPGMDGMTLMQRALEIDPELPIVLVTGHGDVALAVESMRRGAYDFIEKPFAASHLVEVARRALEKRRLTLENRQLRSAIGGRDRLEARLMGRTRTMVQLRQQIRAVSQTDADVLFIGETGTGKEVAARALHAISERAEAPFVAINCGALPVDLIESELFGHEIGAFPGATRARYGKFEHARGGTIFLDEIESMPMALQVKLLRVIQERSIIRLGSNEQIALNVRFIAASKLDLEREAQAGRFRSDLLYRLNVVTLRMPKLSERREDIPRLFTQLVSEAAARYKSDTPPVPPFLLISVAERDWPGNVRELRNAADRYALGLDLDFAHTGPDQDESLADRVSGFERNAIATALTTHNGRLKDTYTALGLSRKSLYEKMQKYNLSRMDFSTAAEDDAEH